MPLERLNPDRTFKILFIGDSSVGKTCLMLRYADNQFSEKLIPTIGVDFKIKTISVRGLTVRIQLWDTAGQEKFFNISRSYYRNADAVVLVYDRTEASSFQNVARWIRCIDENASDSIVRILVGNKSDLHDRLVISTQDGKRLAEKYHIEFFETSAKSEANTNILQMFEFLIEKLVDLNQPKSKQSTDTINLTTKQSNSIYENVVGCCSLATTTKRMEK